MCSIDIRRATTPPTLEVGGRFIPRSGGSGVQRQARARDPYLGRLPPGGFQMQIPAGRFQIAAVKVIQIAAVPRSPPSR